MVSIIGDLIGERVPRCSICIANFNGKALLSACIESILAQDLAVDIEIIVHDDASTDDSVMFLREYYPHVRVIMSEINVGFCIGNNRMARAARAPFLLLLNNDAALMPGALSALLEAATAAPDERVLTLPQHDWQTGLLVDRGCFLDPFYNPVPNLRPDQSEVAMTIGACLWIRRGFWEEIGGFPEWMESIGEDLYLCAVARLRGAKIVALQTSGYRHWQGKTFGGNRVSEQSLSSTVRRRRLSERNKTFAMITCTPTALVWPLLTLHLVLLLLEGTLLSLVRRDRRLFTEIYLNVFAELFRSRKSLRRHRVANLAARRITLWQYARAFRPLPRKVSMLLRYGWPQLRR